MISDPADRLLIFVSGKVRIEFEHPAVQRGGMDLTEGDFIGDASLLGTRVHVSARVERSMQASPAALERLSLLRAPAHRDPPLSRSKLLSPDLNRNSKP